MDTEIERLQERARKEAEERLRIEQEAERKRQEIELAKLEAKEAERKRAEQARAPPKPSSPPRATWLLTRSLLLAHPIRKLTV